MKKILISLLFLIPFWAFSQLKNGEEVLKEMYNLKNRNVQRFMTFDQQTLFFENDMFKRQEKWFEAIGCPGKLIVKMDSMNSGRGILFANDSMYNFEGGKLVKASYKIHDLVWLGFDIYFIHPDISIPQTIKLGYDVSKMYLADHYGKEVYAIGAESVEEKANQFWIDKEKLTVIKVITYGKDGSMHETIFDKFVQMGTIWVGTQLVFKKNGEKWLEEKYSNIKFSSTFNETVFIPKNFLKASW
jgi:hypothetical protein